MRQGSPAASTKDPFSRLLVSAIQLFLLAEGLGWWAVLIVETIREPALFYYGVPGVVYVGLALLLGVPALVLAFRPSGWGRSWRTPVFLILNTLAAIGTWVLAFLAADPVWYYAVLAAVTVGATLLLFLAVIQVAPKLVAFAIAAAGILVGFAATYALPPTVPPAPALHFRGVLVLPGNAIGTVTPTPGGPYENFVLVDGIPWTALTVVPGTYRYTQSCADTLDPPATATVAVPWGAVVRGQDLCPPPGTLRGHVNLRCPSGAPVTCESGPDTGHLITFQAAQTGLAYQAVTDGSGNFTMALAPGIYTSRADNGYVVVTNPLVITVESGATTSIDVTFEPSSFRR
jgi:hypothetical protein